MQSSSVIIQFWNQAYINSSMVFQKNFYILQIGQHWLNLDLLSKELSHKLEGITHMDVGTWKHGPMFDVLQ
jgi:hypothetical protein